MTITLRPATEADIPFVMATERMPGFERTVGRWEEAAHRAEMEGIAGRAEVISFNRGPWEDEALSLGPGQDLDPK